MYKMNGRINRLLKEIETLFNETSLPIKELQVRQGKLSFPCDVTSITDNFHHYTMGDVWSTEGFDNYALFKFQLDIPQRSENTDCFLRIATNKGGGHNMVRPQMLLMTENDIVQGLDTNHELVNMNAYAGQKNLWFYVYAYSGRPKKTPYGAWVDLDTSDGVRFFADLLTRNKTLTDFYYNIKVPFVYAQHFDENSHESTKILNCINDALSFVDFRYPQTDHFYKSVEMANEFVLNHLYNKDNAGFGKATLVGHTHIDLAWLWRYEHTMDKVIRSFATEIKLIAEYPHHRFMSSQAQLYEYAKQQTPEMYEKIRELVKTGQWEIEGSMWCEPDMNLVSGESIIRQIIYGKDFFQKEFGVDCKTLWLPDVFGYTAALPQILKKSGIPYFMTSKLASNERNRFPYDTFTWKGIDGSEVFAHCTNYLTGYNPDIENGDILEGVRKYAQKDLNDDILVPFGFADGGGGVTAEQIEFIARTEKGIPGVPTVQIGTVGDYFNRLNQKVAGKKHLPCWSGEIYYENHRGTYTSMARIKKQNRKAEFLYSNAQWLWALSNCFVTSDFPKEVFDCGMKKILLNQFHDVLPGSSIREVYEDADALYADAFRIGETICSNAVNTILQPKCAKNFTVFNPYSQTVSGYVKIDGSYYYAEDVPAKGYKACHLIQTKPRVPVTFSNNIVESEYYRIQISDNGDIINLYDKKANRTCFIEGKPANRLRIFEDKSAAVSATDNEDNWNLENYYLEKEFDMPAPEKVYLYAADDESVTVRIQRKYMNSSIVQDMIVYARSKRIDFKTEIDWREHSQVLKAEFPVDVNAIRATYEIQFGYVERPTVFNTPWDEVKFEVCGHKWADISDSGYGMALLNDCKYGYSAKDSTLSLTLLRCGNSPNPDADKEHHSFVYSILPHVGTIQQADVVKEAYLLNNPLFVVHSAVNADMPEAFSLFECNGAVLDTIKPAEKGDGLVLRFYEPYNSAQVVTLKTGKKVRRVLPVDIMENPIDNLPITQSEYGLSFPVKPFEIVTLKVWLDE